ncbi:MAG: HAD family hydrolase [Ilumatobacteraceae bacterium]
MAGAAFFDLDRTIVRGASGRVFAETMRAEGLLGRPIPGESALFGAFDLFGENLPSMALARQAAALAKGRDREAVRRAAHAAIPALDAMVQPYARDVLDGHRRAGRQVVLATTTPLDLVDPFAEHLGFDDVVATRYGVVVRDGREVYDGTIDGHFVWSTGMRAAVRQWACANDADLAESYA